MTKTGTWSSIKWCIKQYEAVSKTGCKDVMSVHVSFFSVENISKISKLFWNPVLLTLCPGSRPDQTPEVESPGSSAQTLQRAAGSARQHQDAALERSSFLTDIRSNQRRADLNTDMVPGSGSRKTQIDLTKS